MPRVTSICVAFDLRRVAAKSAWVPQKCLGAEHPLCLPNLGNLKKTGVNRRSRRKQRLHRGRANLASGGRAPGTWWQSTGDLGAEHRRMTTPDRGAPQPQPFSPAKPGGEGSQSKLGSVCFASGGRASHWAGARGSDFGGSNTACGGSECLDCVGNGCWRKLAKTRGRARELKSFGHVQGSTCSSANPPYGGRKLR